MLGGAMTAMRPKLYVLPGSHPCAAVEAALKLKSIDQATQLERFERLRAAYTGALAQIEDHEASPIEDCAID